MVLARAHHPVQYLIKAYFKLGSKTVELVFLSRVSGLRVIRTQPMNELCEEISESL